MADKDGYSSKWRTMGTNSTSTVNVAGAAAGGIGVDDGFSDSPLVNTVRKECQVWLCDNDNGKTYTPNFDWPVDSDFTCIYNGTAATIADAGNIVVSIEGSIDGVNYIELKQLTGAWNCGTDDAGHHVYNFDGDGRMPFMRLAFNGTSNQDTNKDTPCKVIVIPHTI